MEEEVPYNEGLGITQEEFFEKHKRLVYKIAGQYVKIGKRLSYEYDDLVNIGFIGLLKAYRKFDVSYKVAESTYVVPMVRGEIMRKVRDTGEHGLKFSRSYREAAMQINRARLEDETPEYISYKLGMPLGLVESALDYIFKATALSTDLVVWNNDSNPITLGEQLGTSEDFTSVEVEDFLNSLKDKEKTVLLMTVEGMKQREIGEVIGVSQVQASRLLTSARSKALSFFV